MDYHSAELQLDHDGFDALDLLQSSREDCHIRSRHQMYQHLNVDVKMANHGLQGIAREYRDGHVQNHLNIYLFSIRSSDGCSSFLVNLRLINKSG
jgi:hypothetical protein